MFPGVYLPRTITSSNNSYFKILNTTDETFIMPNKFYLKTSLLSDINIFNFSEILKDPDFNKTRTKELINVITKNVYPLYKDDLTALCTKFPEIFLAYC